MTTRVAICACRLHEGAEMLTHEALVLSAILVPADYLVTTSDGSTRTWHEPVGFGVLAAGSRLLTQLN